jgi:hypothetical protein
VGTDGGASTRQQFDPEEFCHQGAGKLFDLAERNLESSERYQWHLTWQRLSLMVEWLTKQVLTCVKWCRGLYQAVSEKDITMMERELCSKGLTVYIDKG